MSSKFRFTEGRVRSLICPAGKPGKQCIYLDTDTPGLGCRVTEGGSRAYVFARRIHGKTARLTIGDVRTWQLGEARAEARRLGTLIDRGIDPRQDAADKRTQAEAARTEAQRQDVQIADAWRIYIAASSKRWGRRHLDAHSYFAQPQTETTTAGPLAPLMALKLTDLTPERIAAWLEREKEDRPTAAASCFRLLRAFVNWTHETDPYKGLVPADACTTRKVRDLVPAPRTKDGDCLQREQLPAWFTAIRGIPNPVIGAYLQGLLLTGARREELAALRWSDTDFQWGSLTIRDKIEGQRVIPLTPYLASLLQALPRLNEWVFSSPKAEEGHLVNPDAHVEALKDAGLPHVSLHGLRRSFGTLSEWVEVPTGIVAQIQGHKPSALAEKHYRRRSLDLLRLWHTKIETWILQQADLAPAAQDVDQLIAEHLRLLTVHDKRRLLAQLSKLTSSGMQDASADPPAVVAR